MIFKEQLMMQRDEWPKMTGTELAIYMSVMNLCGPYDRTVLIYNSSIMHNLTGDIKDPLRRKIVSATMKDLVARGVIVAEAGPHGSYYVDGLKSFFVYSKECEHGFVMIDFSKIRELIRGCADTRQWNGLIKYYVMLMSHMNKDGECNKSLDYFSTWLGISKITLSKYNGQLKNLGLIKIKRNFNSTSTYYST